MRRVSGQLRLALAQYEEVAHFARFGAEIDRATREQITRGEHLREALKQPANAPLALARQVLILYAVSQGVADDLPLDSMAAYEQDLWQFMRREHLGIIRRLERGGDLDDDLAADLRGAIDEHRAAWN
jgi:F-type H+-transporting ATPase subunit alpha